MRNVAHMAGISLHHHHPRSAGIAMADAVYDINDGVLTPGER